MAVTQKDIAHKLGVSPSLVSRVLGGRAKEIGVLPSTIRRIENAARELGYVPNAAALQLKGAGGMVLGVAAADMADPFFGSLLAAIIRASHQRGYALTLAGFEHREAEPREVQLLLQQSLSGLIVAGSGPVDWLAPFIQRGIPIARIGGGRTPRGVHQVEPDTVTGYIALLHHLASLGHRRLAFIGASSHVHRERLAIARRLARTSGLDLPMERSFFCHEDVMQAGETGARALLKTNTHRAAAVICSSDAVAFGALRVFAEQGIRVPRDLSVAGFDDLPLSSLTSPPLTTLRQPVDAMVEQALDCIGAQQPGKSKTRMPVSLIARESTSRLQGT